MPNITIASLTIPGWQGPSTGIQLRIYCNTDFTAASGTFYPRTVLSNPASLGTFFQQYGCTASSGSLVIPQIQLDSTTDSPDNPAATYSAVLWDTNSNQLIQTFGTFASFGLVPTPANTTWQAIFATAGAN